VNINPADTAAMQIPATNKLDHIAMWNRERLIQALIGSQKLSAASAIAN
jgi:hypothetical protein